MTPRGSTRTAVSVLFSTLLIVTILSLGATGAVAADSPTNPTETLSDDELFNGTDDGQVVIWERTFLPLRTDDTSASSRVPLPDNVYLGQLAENEEFTSGDDGTFAIRSLIRDFDGDSNPAGIHNPGEITLSYDAEATDTSAIDGETNVDFIAARLTGSEDGIPEDYSAAVNLFSDIESANTNATFEVISENETLNGDTELTHNFDSSGAYIVYAAANNGSQDGYEINNGQIESINGSVAIVGVDQVVVHEAQASVTSPSSVAPGDDIQFDINTTESPSSQDEEMTHVVAVYDKDTFENSQLEYVIDPTELGPQFDLNEHSQIEHSIANADGIADIEPGISINGVELSNGRITRSVGVGGVIDRLAEDLETTSPMTDPLDPSTTINASVVGVTDAGSQDTVTVETDSGFETGAYQYVVISQPAGDSSSLSTQTGRIDILEQDQDTGQAIPSITEVTIDDTTVATNETVTYTATIDNPLNSSISETISLGEGLDSADINIPAGGEQIVDLTTSFETVGSRTLNVSGENIDPVQTDTVTVVEPVERTFNVEDGDTSVEVDESIRVNVEVKNNRRIEQTIPVNITYGNPGGRTLNRTLQVSGDGATASTSFTFSYQTSGSRTISVEGVSGSTTIDVSKQNVDLAVSAEPSEVVPEENITISAIREDDNSEVTSVSRLNITNLSTGKPEETQQDQSLPYTTSLSSSGEYEITISKSSDRTNFRPDSTTISVLEPASLSLDSASTQFTNVTASRNVRANAIIENTGGIEGTQTIRLVADPDDENENETIADQRVTVSGDGAESITLSGPIQPAGDTIPENRSLEVQRVSDGGVRDSISLGEVRVISAVRVTEIVPQAQTVNNQTTVDINITVANQGTDSLNSTFNTQTVNLTLDGNSTEKDFSPAAGNSITDIYTFGPFDTTGSKDLTVTQSFGEPQITREDLINVTARDIYDVELTANVTTPVAGDPIELSVTAPGDPLNHDTANGTLEATIEIERIDGTPVGTQDTTDGTTTLNVSEPGTYILRTTNHDQTISEDDPIADPGRVQIDVREPGDVEISGASVTQDAARTEPVNVYVFVANPGEVSATETISITGRSNSEATKEVDLGGGESDTITLSTAYNNTGVKSVEVNDSSGNTVQVGDVEIASILRVTDITPTSRSALVNDDVSIDVEITNEGSVTVNDTDLDRTIGLDIGSFSSDVPQDQANQSAFNGNDQYTPGESYTITFTPDTLNPADEPGTRTVSVNETDGGRISVSRDNIDLSLSIQTTSDNQITNNSIEFRVTRPEGSVENATIRLPDRTLTTDDSGVATAEFDEPVSETITAVKSDNATESYSDASAFLTISEPADISVASATTNTTQAFAGQSVDTEVAVTNFGGVSGDITLNLTTQENPDEILDNQTVTDLASGDTREIALTTELDATGETTLVVNGQTADTVTVADALAVTQRDVPTAVNSTTETFAANVTVTDRVSDGETGSLDVSLTIGDETVNRTIAPDDGESNKTEFTFNTPDRGTYAAEIAVGDAEPASLSDVVVSQNTVDLDLTVEPSEVKLGEELTFTVEEGENNDPAAGASVEVAGETLATGSDGKATTTIPTAGNYTAEARKEANGTTNTSFQSDSAQVNVTDSLNISIDAEFGEVDAAPTQGDSRPSDSVQPREVTIENTGGRSIALSGFGFTGIDADQYTITSNTPSSVPADSSRTIDVTFEPTVRSNTDANLRFRTDTSNSIRTFTLNGTGVGPDVELNTTALEFGSDLSESDLPVNRTINVTNEGNEPLSLTPDDGSVSDGFTAPSATTIPAQESRDLTVEFNASDLGEFDDVLDIETNDTFAGTVGVSLSGTVSQTELSVSTTSVDVGEVPVDTTTSTDIVVSNTGTEQLTKINTTNETVSNGLNITSPSDDEPVVENLSAGSQQLITIEVTPTTDADQSKANLTVVPSGEATNKTVTINATPTAPALSVSPSVDPDPARDYGETPIGSSKTRQFTLDNTGDAPLQVSNLQINSSNPPSPFRLPDSTQDLEIPAGEEEAVTVAFTPQTPGEKTDSELEFEWNNASADGTTTVSAALRGDGTRTNISATSSTVTFDTTGIGSTDEQQLEITNDGSESVSITNTLVNSLRGKFSVDEGTIPADIPAGESRNITIAYTPDEAGTDTTNLQVDATSGPTDSSLTVTLEGEGAPPIAQLTDQSLSFGYVNSIDSDTASATTRIENAGINTTTLNITDASISGTDADAFSIDESPVDDSPISGSPVNVGNPSAAATVSFDPAPSDDGELTARLTIETNDPDNAEIDVPLRGVATTPEATVNRTTIGFGDVPVNANSATEGIQIRNQGGAPLEIDETTLNDSTHFTITEGFTGELVPGETATVTVTAAPTATGSHSTDLKLTTAADAVADPSVELTTTGIEPDATVTSNSNIFGEFGTVGTGSSAVQTLTVENNGRAVLTLDDISASGDTFTILGSQETVRLSEGDNTEIPVAFSPTEQGEQSDGTLSIDTNDETTQTITRELNGTAGQADATVNKSTVEFGQVQVDATDQQQLTLSNDGGSSLNIEGADITGTDESAFSLSGLGTPTIGTDDETTFTVSTTPGTAQSLSAQLEIQTAEASDVNISLGAVGTEPDLEVASSLSFDRTRIGTSSTQTLEIRNTGNAQLNISSLQKAGTDQFTTGTVPTTIQPKDSRTLTVRFTPNENLTAAKQGTQQTATLTLNSNDPDTQSKLIDLTAQSKTPDLQVDNTLRYGTLKVGQEDTKTLEISNDGTATADITIDELTLLGSNADEFSATVQGSRTLERGDTRDIQVTADPDSSGIKTASLLVRTNDPRESRTSTSISNSRTIVIVRYGSVTFDYTGVTTTDPKFKSSSDPSTGVIGLDPTLNVVTDFNMTFSTLSETTATDGGIDSARPVEPVRYLDISTDNLNADQHDQSRLEFRVSKSQLNALGTPEDGVELYQYNDSANEYTSLDTTREPGRDNATAYAYSATFDTLNDLAIGAGQPSLSVNSATTTNVPTRLAPNEDATVDIETTIDNTGTISGSETFEVVDNNGNTLATQSISADADGSNTTTIPVSITGPGSRTLTVQGTTTDTDASTSFNIAASQPALNVTGTTARNVPGELANSESATVTIDTTIENTGPATGTNTLEIVDADGTTRNSTSITVNANSNIQRTVTVDVTGPGTRTFTAKTAGTSASTTFTIDTETTSSSGDGGGGGGAPAEDDTDEASQTPTVEQVREELEQSEPTTQSSTEIVDDDPDTPGVSVSPENTQSVRRISFENEDASGTVEVTEYDTPPESVSDSISGAIADSVTTDEETQDGTDESTADESQDSTQDSTSQSSVNVATVADISPSDDSARNSPATVTMTVERTKLDDDPSDAFIVHERDDSWERLETTVEETGEEEVTLEGRTDSFSLFAVAELDDPEQQTGGTQEDDTQDDGTQDDGAQDDGTQDDDGQDDSGQPGLIVLGILVIVAVIGAIIYARNNA